MGWPEAIAIVGGAWALAWLFARMITAAANSAAPTVTHPATFQESRHGDSYVEWCAKHEHVEKVAGPFCPACSLSKTLRDGIEWGRETEAAFPTRQHKGCAQQAPAPRGE